MDANILQYVADYLDFVLGLINGYDGPVPSQDPALVKELEALQKLFFWEQVGDGWLFPATPGLLKELHQRKPGQKLTHTQEELYEVFLKAWQDNGIEDFPMNEAEVDLAETLLPRRKVKDLPDRRRIAEAMVLHANYFLTNDKKMIANAKKAQLPFRVCRPSECIDHMLMGL